MDANAARESESPGIVGVVGGSIGHKSFDRATWSGSSRFLFTALHRNGDLVRAFGARPAAVIRYALMTRNYSLDRERWRTQYYFDPLYRRCLTQAVVNRIDPSDFAHTFLQIGAMFNLPRHVQGKAICMSYHDSNIVERLQSRYMPPGVSPKRIEQAFRYESELYAQMDRILTMSEYHRSSFIRHFGLPAGKVVNAGCAPNLEHPPEPQADKRYDNRELLFVGADFQRKGGPLLLRAFRAVLMSYPDARLHIAGPAALEIPSDLRSSVRFHGFLSKQDPEQARTLDALFRRCCLFVLPSYYEGVGISSLEAMLYELPCVVTGAWGFFDSVIPGVTGDLVECGSLDSLVSTLRGCLGDPARLRAMGTAARRLILERFTWTQVARRIAAAIPPDRVPAPPPGGPADSNDNRNKTLHGELK